MGIDVSGGMFVGAKVSEISIEVPEEFEEVFQVEYLTEYLSNNFEECMERYSPWFDADEEECWVGFSIPDVPVSLMNEKWITKVHGLGEKFEEITGTPASLIGMQDVW